MNPSDYSDASLMAYADGELDVSTRAAIEEALAHDAVLAARVQRFTDTAVLARQAFQADLDEPVPDHLRAAVVAAIARHEPAPRAGISSPVDARPRALAGWREWLSGWMPSPAALAASLAVGVLAGYSVIVLHRGEGAPQAGGVVFHARETASITQALNGLASGEQTQTTDGRVMIVHSVRDHRGVLCREFRLERAMGDAVAGIGCRENGSWSVAFAQVTPDAQSAFSPASSTPALDAFLSAIGAGAALTAEQERNSLDEIRR